MLQHVQDEESVNCSIVGAAEVKLVMAGYFNVLRLQVTMPVTISVLSLLIPLMKYAVHLDR